MRPSPLTRLFSLEAVTRLALAAGLSLAPVTAQTFSQPTVVPTSKWPAAIYTADINGDGFPDLVYIEQGATPTASTTHVLLNDGKGNFQQSAVLATAGDSIALGDMTGSGHIDIAWIYSGPGTFFTAAFSTGKGDGTFSQAITQRGGPGYAIPGIFEYLTAARIRANGPLDLLAMNTNLNQIIDIYKVSNQPGPYNVDLSAPLLDGSGPIFVTDINGDGYNDLVINNQKKSDADILLGNKYADFPIVSSVFSGTYGIRSMLLQDVNNDGRPDLIAEGTSGRIDIFTGNGDGTFATTSSGGTGTLDGTTGNGGHLIALANRKLDSSLYALAATPIGVSSLLSNSTAYLGLNGIYNAGPGHTAYATADFDGDGNLDLAVDSPEGIAILYGRPDGSFNGSRAYAAGQPATSAALGAFTTGGKLDVIVGTSATQAQLLQGQGTGAFVYLGSPAAPVTTQSSASNLVATIQAGDFNGDGNLDIAFTADGPIANLPANGTGLTVQLGDGTGHFGAPINPVAAAQFTFPPSSSCSPPFNHFPGTFFGSSVVGDFNQDGQADIANRDSGAFRILRGNNGSATQSNTTNPTLFWSGVDGMGNNVDCDAHAHELTISGDLNGDGHPDLVFQGSGPNAGALQFYVSAAGAAPVFVGDFSVAGSLTSPGQMVAPALSNVFGGTVATSAGGLGFPAFIGSAVIADLDGDGNNDLIVAYDNMSADHTAPTSAAPNYIYVWYGSGGGKFLTSAAHPVNPVRITPSRNFYQVAVGKVGASGQTALVMSDGYVLSVGPLGTETHFLAGQGVNGIAIGSTRGNGVMDIVVANGGSVLANPVANKDQPAPAQDVNTGGVTVLLGAIPAATQAGTVTASPEPSIYGNGFSLTATLTAITTPGTFNFSIDGVSVGSAQGSGSATIAGPNTLAVGTHALAVTWISSLSALALQFTGTHVVTNASSSLSLLLCVDPPGSNFPCGTPLSVTPLINPITFYYGQSVDGIAIESSSLWTGTINFYNGSSIFCTLSTQGSNVCPYSSGFFPVGSNPVYVTYSGDANFSPATSNSITVTVFPDTTTSAITSSLNPAPVGTPVTFTATITGNFATPTGNVTFFDGLTQIGTGTLNAQGQATFTTSTLAVGSHAIAVSYSGNVDFNPAGPALLTEVITPLAVPVASAITLASSVNPSAPGQQVTFTASLSIPSVAIIPAGFITFFDGTTTLGTATINPATGIATYSTSTLALGSHPITAAYTGSTGTPVILAATSAILTQVVAIPQVAGDFTVSVTPVPVTLGVGRTGVLQVAVRESSNFSQPVQLTCSGLPVESSCVFVQSTIPAGGGTTTLYFAVAAPHDCNSNVPYFLGSAQMPKVPISLATILTGGLLLFGLRRNRKHSWRALLLLLLTMGGLFGLSGCGHCTDLGTRPGNYSFTVTGTATSGTHSQTVPLTVTIP